MPMGPRAMALVVGTALVLATAVGLLPSSRPADVVLVLLLVPVLLLVALVARRQRTQQRVLTGLAKDHARAVRDVTAAVESLRQADERGSQALLAGLGRLEQAGGEHLARVDGLRAAVQDVEGGLHRSVAASEDRLMGASRSLSRTMDARLRREFRQVEGTVHLARLLDLPLLPQTRGWAASPDVLRHLLALVEETTPRLVVECGSGVSTVVTAAYLRRRGMQGRVVALEHEPAFAAATRRLVAAHGLEAWAEVRDAPLVTQDYAGRSGPWYSPDAYQDLAEIGVLFVDGPPQAVGDRAREPARHLLDGRLATRHAILLDDTSRDEDAAVARDWAEHFGCTVESLTAEKGAVVLRPAGGTP